MAISFVGNNLASVTGPTVLTLSLPAMLQGDMVLIITATPEDLAGPARPPTTAGYTTILDQKWGIPAAGRLHTSYKFMGATPDGSVTITASASGMGLATLALVFRGVSPTTPLDVEVTTGAGTAGIPRAPAITPINPDCCVVIAAECQLADTSVGSVSGVTAFFPSPTIQCAHDIANSAGDITVAAAYRILTTPVATTPPAWSTWTSGIYLSHSIALRPLTVSTDFNTVDKGDVTTAGKAIVERELVAVSKAAVRYLGKTINIPDSSLESIYVEKYRIVITGKEVITGDVLRSISVTPAAVLYRGRIVTPREIVFEDVPRYRVKGRGSGHWMETR
jgi:hypothetical protein